jgi:hypothetical protein
MEGFLVQKTSADGHPILVGGLGDIGVTLQVEQAYKALEKLHFKNSKDGYAIDYILAKAVAGLSPRDVFVCGATVWIDGVWERAGGVLGSPRASIESSAQNVEEIGNGLILLTRSGGPGIAFTGDLAQGIYIQKRLEEIASPLQYILQARALLEKENVNYMIVADGCGEGGYPMIEVMDGKKRLKRVLPQKKWGN